MRESNDALSESSNEIEQILAEWVLGMTMIMAQNVYLNSNEDEFEDFLFKYSKHKHKYEGTLAQCDGCNGIDIARDQINSLITNKVVEELEALKDRSHLDDSFDYYNPNDWQKAIEERIKELEK